MKTYTINGKEYTEFDINKRCAEIMGLNPLRGCAAKRKEVAWARVAPAYDYNPCQNPSDTWSVIDEAFNTLNGSVLRSGGRRKSHWQDLMQKHNCTRLVAACICLIEVNGGE